MALTEGQKKAAEKNRKYWEQRELEQKKHNITEEKEYSKHLNKIYEDMLDNVQKEIDAFYGKYAKAEGISLSEAKKRVSQLDIEAYERKAKRYVENKDFSKEANEEMRLYNATMKINRLEMLKANIGLELISGHEELQKYMEGILQGRTEEELKRQAGILGETIKDNAKAAHAIVNASFHNAKYSDRIWMHQDILKAELSKQLQSGLIQGKNPRVLAKNIRQKFDVSKASAETLMRTELARVQTEAQKLSFERNGFEQYTFLALGDACGICKELNDKHFYVKDMMPGTNAPPMHPNCRCSTSAYEDSEDYDKWLEHLEKGGTTESWNELKEAFENEDSKTKYKYEHTLINKKLIESADYRKKFDKISDDPKVNREVWKRAVEMLKHRTGTKYEDLAFIDSWTTKSIINKTFDKENHAKPNKKMKEMLKEAKEGTIIGIHNHPGSSEPSIADINVCKERNYKFGIVVCHDGTIYKYSVDKERLNEPMAISALAKLAKKEYNDNIKDIFKNTGIDMEVL